MFVSLLEWNTNRIVGNRDLSDVRLWHTASNINVTVQDWALLWTNPYDMVRNYIKLKKITNFTSVNINIYMEKYKNVSTLNTKVVLRQ